MPGNVSDDRKEVLKAAVIYNRLTKGSFRILELEGRDLVIPS